MNKRQLLLKLVHIPSKVPPSFWAREFKILNSLLKKYPHSEFWDKLKVDKVNSLTLYAGEDVFSIQERYNKFLVTNPIQKVNHTINKRKSGKDLKITKSPKTIKDFLNEKKSKKRR
jgi:hypothetical protein